MEKSEFRVLIKHYFLRKKTVNHTKEKLDKYYGDSAQSISMVKKWFTDFRCGRPIEKLYDMVTFCNCGWNMNPLQHSGDQAAV